ncbi:xanthine dehydrogenase family protein molybdopterin-binding subunit [Spiractinospora alimapuensis]|uniref:xanthine dehydrogenase family protein molybdopterin-binding subunit n=1 Tax=Spiractinospora alimapuensis TaxID=2820884 RepID=UPI001F2B6D50|nr:xanthine dehydrogenase family protein molybdopterin-binding subunit [Spiractinospora alimapuensis]
MTTGPTELRGSIFGHEVRRVEDSRLIVGGGEFIDNLNLPGTAHVAFVRSPLAHARVHGVSTEEARKSPGVLAVVTHADIDHHPLPTLGPIPTEMRRQLLADGIVRYVGEPVAVVVAETRAEAVDAVDLVDVDYEPLTAVVDADEAVADNVLLFPDVGTNTAINNDRNADAFTPAFFDDCEVVVRVDIANQRIAPTPMEPRAAAARWEGDRLQVWASTQEPHGLRGDVAQVLGLPADRVRVIAPAVGGGFGAKTGGYPEYCVMGALSAIVDRPVTWIESRSECMVGLGHGRAQSMVAEMGGDHSGNVSAYRLSVQGDIGAYPLLGAVLPGTASRMGPAVYDIERYATRSRAVVTNTVPVVPYRGAGRPEAAYAAERAMDAFAAEIGMDPVELRHRNLLGDDRFPHRTATGMTYDSGAYAAALDTAVRAAEYDSLREEQRARREAGDTVQLGVGVSTYVEITNPAVNAEHGAVDIDAEGNAVVRSGTHSHGQGHETMYGMILAEVLGIASDRITFIQGDTDVVPTGGGTSGSRSLQVGGSAVHSAARKVLDQARELAATILEASADDLVFDTSTATFTVQGVPGVSVGWADLGAYAADHDETLGAAVDYQPAGATFPFGAHIAVVEVDTETGGVRLRQMIAVDDCGRILNPMLVAGQVHGGVAQGISQALFEEVRYDAAGNIQTGTLADYTIPSAADLPDFDRVPLETPTPLNELGAKGIGESGTIGSTPAVANAIVDALSHLGVTHINLPATPERVWETLRDARSQAVLAPTHAPPSQESPDAHAHEDRPRVPRVPRESLPAGVLGRLLQPRTVAIAAATVGAALAVRYLRNRLRRRR